MWSIPSPANRVSGFEVLTVAVMKSSVFWDIRPCNGLHGVISQKTELFKSHDAEGRQSSLAYQMVLGFHKMSEHS
jgi:hypothetical protein